MLRTLRSGVERWPLRAPFRIARGARTEAQVVTVTLGEDGAEGRGEATPYARYGETAESVLAQIAGVERALRDGADREALRALLPAGAARNAVDCALWDLDAALGRGTALSRAGPVTSAKTVSLDTPAAMAAAARELAGAALVKVKLDAGEPEACLRAVRAELPGTRLIVDANEAWTMPLLERLQPALHALDVTFVEQPLPAGEDAALAGFAPLVPLCADESCHTAADAERLRDRYAIVNIKLDKTGGLTEALDLLAAARALDMGVMVGCMLCTSLAIAPALHVAQLADHADLDGPWWLAADRPGGIAIADDGRVIPPENGFWGRGRGPIAGR